MVKPIKLLILFAIFASVSFTVKAQNLLDRLILDDAKTAYASENYELSLQKIDELEKRGNKGLVILHLKIMATSKIEPQKLTIEQVEQFKKEVDFYLKNHDNEDFMQQYRDVYEVSQTLSAKEYSLGFTSLVNAHRYYIQKDFKTALELYLLSAENNGLNQSEELGIRVASMYETGVGTEKNEAEAIKWYKISAEHSGRNNPYKKSTVNYVNSAGVLSGKGHWEILQNYGGRVAQFRLAELYRKGTSKNYQESIKWYKLSADQDYYQAQIALGEMYQLGLGTEKDPSEAFNWYKLAADQGSSIGQAWVGEAYLLGFGVEKNVDMAIDWLSKSVANGNRGQSYTLGNIFYEQKAGLDKIASLKTAIGHYETAAKLPHWAVASYIQIAYCNYDLGRFDLAIENIKKALAADPKSSRAYESLGDMFFRRGAKEQAINAYKKAAELGSNSARDWLNKNAAETQNEM